eukprot:jgi/Mesvir1/5347/Mv15436-RA.1
MGERRELFFSGINVDRSAHLRGDKSWLEKATTSEASKFVPVLEDGSCFITDDGKAVLLTPSEASRLRGGGDHEPTFLGLGNMEEGLVPVFAVTVSQALVSSGAVASLLGIASCDLKRQGLSPTQAGLLAYGRGMLEWRKRQRFCGACGAPTALRSAGHELACTSDKCGAVFYPRQDPAVIARVTSGDHILLGRQASWPKGRYSCLAGFCELGESFEMAVAREVKEESGIIVDPASIRYRAVQPWLFPSSVMIGYSARAVPASAPAKQGETTTPFPGANGSFSGPSYMQEQPPTRGAPVPVPGAPQGLQTIATTDELEEARWFHRDWLRHVLLDEGKTAGSRERFTGLNDSTPFSIPGDYAIAHTLIMEWVRGDSEREDKKGEGANPVAADSGAQPWPGASLPVVDIDVGVFKYVHVRVTDGRGNSIELVRGDRRAEYHANISDKLQAGIKSVGLSVTPLGGGRMEHYPDQGVLHVYGFSYAFGQADHLAVAELVRKWRPLLTSISTSNEGY